MTVELIIECKTLRNKNDLDDQKSTSSTCDSGAMCDICEWLTLGESRVDISEVVVYRAWLDLKAPA